MRTTRGLGVAAITATLTLMLAAPAVAQDAPRTITFDEAAVEDVTWELSQYSDGFALVDVPDDDTTTLLMEAGRVSGSAGCNTFSGTYEIDDHIIRFSDELAVTQAFCEGAAQEVEDAFLALLPTVVAWAIVDGQLEMNDGGEMPVLVFGDGSFEMSMSQMTAITNQLEDLQDAVAELTLRMSNLEGASSGSTDAETKPARAKSDGKVRREFAELGDDPNRGLVRWRDMAVDEDGYHVYARRIGCAVKGGSLTEKPSKWVRIAKLPSNATEYRPRHMQVESAIPEQSPRGVGTGSLYEVGVAPFNEAGEAKPVVVAAYFTTPEYSCHT
jgi:heat shock protein HslJ